jgi:hypothetical protein
MKAVFFCAPFLSLKADLFGMQEAIIRMTLPINRKYFESTVLYTTLGTHVDPDLGFDEVIPIASPYHMLTHYMRVSSWHHYLASDRFDRDTVFLDYDLIVNRPFQEVFDHDYALAFTASDSKKTNSRINTGCILAKHSGKEKAIFHAKKIMDIAFQQRMDYDVRYPKIPHVGAWGGDERSVNTYLSALAKSEQQSLRKIVASVGFDEFRPLKDGITLFGIKYNCKVGYLDEADWGKPTILHFCGHKDKLAAIAAYSQRLKGG